MIIQLTTTQWLALSPAVKSKLKELFAIPRSEGTQMIDNRVLSDGHNHRDLARITVEAMQNYTGNKKQKDFFKLFEATLAKVEEEINPVVDAPAAPAPVVVAKPAEELYLEHNGKTYKLTEVPTPSAPQVAAQTPLYGAAQAQQNAATVKASAGAGKAAGKRTTRRSGTPGGKAKGK